MSTAAIDETRRSSAQVIKYGVRCLNPGEGETSFLWRYGGSNTVQHRVTVQWTRDHVYPPWIQLVLNDGAGTNHATARIPDDTFCWNVIIRPSSCFLSLQKTLKNGQPIEMWAIFFDIEHGRRNHSINLLNAITNVVRQLPYEKVPFFNLGGRLPPPVTRAATALAYYNLRQPTTSTSSLDPEYKPWALVFAANLSTIEFHNHVAKLHVRRFLAKVTGGRFATDRELVFPPAESSMTAVTIREIEPASVQVTSNGQDPTAMSTPTKCGACGEDETPLGQSVIKNRMSRKKWVGCQNAEDCRSKNFWFHFKCCDAEWSRVQNKAHRWYCPACRGDVDARLVDGKYIRIPRRH